MKKYLVAYNIYEKKEHECAASILFGSGFVSLDTAPDNNLLGILAAKTNEDLHMHYSDAEVKRVVPANNRFFVADVKITVIDVEAPAESNEGSNEVAKEEVAQDATENA